MTHVCRSHHGEMAHAAVAIQSPPRTCHRTILTTLHQNSPLLIHMNPLALRYGGRQISIKLPEDHAAVVPSLGQLSLFQTARFHLIVTMVAKYRYSTC
jgi:hypothetical protein